MTEYYKDRKCSVCHTSMYCHSDGMSYSCRNFDCPPGNEKAHSDSWMLTRILQPILLDQPMSSLSVREARLIQNGGADKEVGPAMLRIARRLKCVPKELESFKLAEDRRTQ